MFLSPSLLVEPVNDSLPMSPISNPSPQLDSKNNNSLNYSRNVYLDPNDDEEFLSLLGKEQLDTFQQSDNQPSPRYMQSKSQSSYDGTAVPTSKEYTPKTSLRASSPSTSQQAAPYKKMATTPFVSKLKSQNRILNLDESNEYSANKTMEDVKFDDGEVVTTLRSTNSTPKQLPRYMQPKDKSNRKV